ncbi:hypothetical protein G7Z17_g5864 [Cylindrodendrum hubeiense]|uniref:Fungal STAND N-terminal Goodbye domain-containing protein n=1 Tax=Cylindrodendrum hubeiense TaxID=595255 RepID=A0A9P5L8R4_9HYPO|nr:hypothetical protein G7Z17_g5864 [Cylindrodendrum hubeiense]
MSDQYEPLTKKEEEELMNLPSSDFEQSWTESGYPIVDGKYLDLSTGIINTIPDGTLVAAGPPALEVHWHNRMMTGRSNAFFSFVASAFVNVTEYLKRVGEFIAMGSVEILSLNATKYAVNIVVATDLSKDEMMGRIKQCISGIPKSASAKSRDISLEQQKTVDEIWQQVQAKVIQLAGGDATKIRKLGIDDVLSHLDSFQDSKKPQKVQRLKGVIDKTLQCIQTVGSIVSSGVSTVFGPADMCCNALTFVIQAWQGYEGMLDNLAELLEKCMEFLDRLEYYNEKMDARLTRVACQNLQLFVEICDRTIKLRKKHTRFLAFTKMLFLNDDGIQDLLGMMDRLNSKESLLVAAQTFEIVSDSADNIKTIVEGQKEQRSTQDAQERRLAIVEALGFRPAELGQKGEPIATWKRSFDVYKNSVIAATGDWLWEDDVFLDWSQAAHPQNPIIILQGNNGSGKTSMMANTIKRLQKQGCSTSRIVTAYFFPEYDVKNSSQDPRQVLETASKALLWQISVSFEAMAKSVAQIAQASPGYDGWLDIWDQLFVNNTERFNSDTTFFIFVDGLDTDMRGFVSVFEKLCSVAGMGKVRLMLTAGPRMVTECIRQMKGVKFEVIPLADRNSSDIEKYINYRMDAMPTLRDLARAGISEWRERILVDLTAKCAGDYYKLNSSLNALAQMDLVEDIEGVLADANKTRTDQIDAEIIHLNKIRTPKEIQEINDIILWVDNGRRWFPVDMIEALISMKHQPGFGAPNGDTLGGQETSRGAALTVSLLPLSQKLAEKYPLFAITKTKTVKWRTPETKDRIPSKAAPERTLGLPRIQETEINIVRHFLQNVCPGEMYGRFEFEHFFEAKLVAQHQECICRDVENAHIKIVIAYLAVMTDKTAKNSEKIIQHARRDLLFHLKQVDLSAADKQFKVQVGPLLVKLLTEEKGITSLFMSTKSMPLWDWARTEASHLKEIRAEWVYSVEGIREVSRWLSDTTVTKFIQGDEAKSFVEGVNSPPVNLHNSVAAKELEDPKNFTPGTIEVIEAWATVALNKSENSRAQDSHWEVRACVFMGSMSPDIPTSQLVLRAQQAVNIDPKNFDARLIMAADKSLTHKEAVETLSKVKQELELNLGGTPSALLAKTTMALGNRMWDLGEDHDLAAHTQLECLLHGYCGIAKGAKYSSILDRYTKKNDFDRVLAFLDGLNNCHQTWRPYVDEIVFDLQGCLVESQQIAEAADANQQWEVLETFYNSMIDSCVKDGFDELVFALRRFFAETLDESSNKARRENRVAIYETALEKINDNSEVKESIGTFLIYLVVDNLAAAYAEKAFALEANSETVELYISKLTGLLAFAENDGKSLQALTPVCCLVKHNQSNGHFADLTKTWTRKVMLEIIELLSDDDETNDYDAYFFLYQFLIALGDFKNSRVAVSMLKWTCHLDNIRKEEKKRKRVETEYITKGFQRAVSKEDETIHKVTGDTQGDAPSTLSDDNEVGEPIESNGASTEVATHTVRHDSGQQQGSTDPPSITDVMDDVNKETDEPSTESDCSSANDKHDDDPSSSKLQPEVTVDKDTPPHTWSLLCDGCKELDIAEDRSLYVCVDCVQAIFVDAKCYASFKKGEKLEVRLDCSKDHEFFYVPAWKQDVEFPSASVPVFSAEGDGDEIELQGWLPLEEWKSQLRKLYIDN